MWLSGQQKRPAECGEGQTGIVTMTDGGTAVLLDSERRGLEVYAPAGYRWTPRAGQRVLVIQGRGEIPGIVGVRQDSAAPDRVSIEAGGLALRGETVKLTAREEAEVQAEGLYLPAKVFIDGEPLEDYIIRIARMGG